MLNINSILYCYFFFLKSFFDTIGLGLIVPFITSLTDPQVILTNYYFKLINQYLNIDTTNELIIYLSLLIFLFYLFKNLLFDFNNILKSKVFILERSKLVINIFDLYEHVVYQFYL